MKTDKIKYKVVVGYYPSENSAKKVEVKVNQILAGVKIGDDVKAKTIHTEDCYIVYVYETEMYDIADDVFSQCMQHNIYCGIDVSKWKKSID